VRGRADLVLPAGDDGPGAGALLRPEGADLFALGSREAVLTALRGDVAARHAFGTPAEPAELRDLLAGLTDAEVAPTDAGLEVVTHDARAAWAVEVAAYAHGWEVAERSRSRVRLRPGTP